MATRQITCPTCTHAFVVAADARTAICPRCGKALPILSSGISLNFEMPIPKKKGEKREASVPAPPPPPQEAKLAKISLRKASEKRPARGFEDLSAVTKPSSSAQPADLPPAPEATIPGERGYQVEILPRQRRGHSEGATGIDLPMRPAAARVDPNQYLESSVGMDEPTAVPHEGGELIQVESGEWPSHGQEQVVDDDTWAEEPIDEAATSPEAFAPPLPPLPPRVKGAPPPPQRHLVPPARRPSVPPPRPAPPPPPPRELATAQPSEDDPRVTAMRLKAIDDDDLPAEALQQLSAPDDLGSSYDEVQPDLEGLGDLAPPSDRAMPIPDFGQPPDFYEPSAEASTISGSSSVPHAPLARERTANFHRDRSPSARVAALTDAIDDEVSREIPIPPAKTASAVYPPPQTPATMTNLGIGPNQAADSGDPLDDDAPLVLPDTGIMVFVPDQPIEERSIGEEKPAPAVPRYKSGGTLELSPLQLRRRPLAAGGHGVATRGSPSNEIDAQVPKKRRLWIALLAGSLVLVALVVGLVLALR